jgi:hypothetical protein
MNTPPPVLKRPLGTNSSHETSTETVVTSSTGQAEGPHQRHSVTVGTEADVSVPAGLFRAILVSWRVFTEGASASEDREMYFAADRGLIQFIRDGSTYKLRTGVEP